MPSIANLLGCDPNDGRFRTETASAGSHIRPGRRGSTDVARIRVPLQAPVELFQRWEHWPPNVADSNRPKPSFTGEELQVKFLWDSVPQEVNV